MRQSPNLAFRLPSAVQASLPCSEWERVFPCTQCHRTGEDINSYMNVKQQGVWPHW